MKNIYKVILALSILVLFGFHHVLAGQPEKYYQAKWCEEQGGRMEYRLLDRARVDCLTETHAVEFDFERKWAEAIGQALYYSARTGKRAGIVLIQTGPDGIYLERLKATIDLHHLPIDVWTVER